VDIILHMADGMDEVVSCDEEMTIVQVPEPEQEEG
jgi:hypothetical protein